MAALGGPHVYRGGIEAQGGSTLRFRSRREDPDYLGRRPESAVTCFPSCSAALPGDSPDSEAEGWCEAHRNVASHPVALSRCEEGSAGCISSSWA